MKTHHLRFAVAVAVALVPGVARAQHEGHQAGAPQPSPEMAQCARVQPAVNNIITGAMARLEASRVSNNPADMRAAVDQLETSLRDIRAQLAPCASPAAAADPHAGHTTPGVQQAPGVSTPEKPAPAAADPHAGHKMPPTPAAPKDWTPAKPEGSKPERPHTADPHAGHASGQRADQQMDPVNGLMVDPATSPKVTHEGKTYYFSSEQTRKEFLSNPAKFTKKKD